MRFLTITEFRTAVQAFQSGTTLLVDGGQVPPLDPKGLGGDLNEVIEAVKAFANSPADAKRRDDSLRKDRMLSNEFKDDLIGLCKLAFHPKTYENLKLTLHTSTNLLVEIVGKLSALYDAHPKRYLRKEKPDTAKGDPRDAADLKSRKLVEEEPPGPKPASVEELAGRSILPAPEEPTDSENDPEFEALLSWLDLEDDDEEGDAFEAIARCSHLDVYLQKIERLARAHPCVWVRPHVCYDSDAIGKPVEISGRLEFVVYTPATAGILTDPENPAIARAFYYFAQEVSGGRLVSVLHVYTTTAHVKLDAEFKPIGPVDLNPLGRLPVTKFEIDLPINGYYCKGIGDDLYDATLELCLLKSIQNQRAKDTAFKQLAIQGDPKNLPADQVMGGAAPIILGEGMTASVLDLSPDLETWTNLVRERAKDIQTKYGITVESETSGGPESGYAKKLKMAAVLRENKRVRPHFLRGEKDLFELVGRMLEISPVPEIPPVPDGDLVIDFVEPTIDENPKEQAEIDAQEITLGTTNVIEILARKNPDLSEPELARMAYRNRLINEALTPSKADRLIDYLSLGAKANAVQGIPAIEGSTPPPGAPAGGTPGAPGKPPASGKPGAGAPPPRSGDPRSAK
jgi:hypothetical protein